MKTRSRKPKPRKFRWECHWTNGKGGYNPDFEDCKCSGTADTLAEAVEKAKEHNRSHPWRGWGYAPSDWRNQTVNVEEILPGGKTKMVVRYDEL